MTVVVGTMLTSLQPPSSSTLRHSLQVPQRPPRRYRRQTPFPPGVRPTEIPGVPLVWDARLALARVWQCYRQNVQFPGLGWRDKPKPPVVEALARDCGILIGPSPARIVTVCPSCRAEVITLRAAPNGWCCCRCDSRRWRWLEVAMGAYAMGLRIGLTGRPMVHRWHRLMRQLTCLAYRARTLSDVLLLVAGAELVQYSPHWKRYKRSPGLPPVPRNPGPLFRGVGPDLVTAVVESLHPIVFFQQYFRA